MAWRKHKKSVTEMFRLKKFFEKDKPLVLSFDPFYGIDYVADCLHGNFGKNFFFVEINWSGRFLNPPCRWKLGSEILKYAEEKNFTYRLNDLFCHIVLMIPYDNFCGLKETIGKLWKLNSEYGLYHPVIVSFLHRPNIPCSEMLLLDDHSARKEIIIDDFRKFFSIRHDIAKDKKRFSFYLMKKMSLFPDHDLCLHMGEREYYRRFLKTMTKIREEVLSDWNHVELENENGKSNMMIRIEGRKNK